MGACLMPKCPELTEAFKCSNSEYNQSEELMLSSACLDWCSRLVGDICCRFQPSNATEGAVRADTVGRCFVHKSKAMERVLPRLFEGDYSCQMHNPPTSTTTTS